ncbi:hypothetical protein OS493_031318 [Desmophyllum pertusum]|uniref:ABC transmembrane type-1 domain-containing protein n=1 Tax=Desmophyllum pertusum TaxID=174260 RepID=A0A9W9YW77_9CNID|nr:hypothetical protein OS493_031318 [Desmophyllum pertusum]
MARKAAKLREKAAAFTDERLVVMNEIISGIRAVKMYAWEWNFRDVVGDLRRNEMAIIRSKGVIVSMVVILYFTTLPIAVLISVTSLVFTGTQLSSFTIFTVLLTLMTVRNTFCFNLSICIQAVADAKIALDRIQAFLEEKVSEHDPNRLSTEQVNHDDNLLVQCKGKENTMAVQVTNNRKRHNSADENSQTFTSNSKPTRTPIIFSAIVEEESLETSEDQVSGREHTSFLYGGVMYSLVEHSPGSALKFVRYDCRSYCHLDYGKSWC